MTAASRLTSHGATMFHHHRTLSCCRCGYRFMFLWLSALPWSMWQDAHWMVVPITGVVSYLLLGIGEQQCFAEAVGLEVQSRDQCINTSSQCTCACP